jgi:hypothetical protein
MPGTYSVALVAGGRTLDTKPLKIIMDPAVQLSVTDRKRYDALVMELHDGQRLGIHAAAALNGLYPQVAAAATMLKASNAPPAVKTQFESFKSEFDAVRVKFGVPAGVAAGRGGGGGGRGGADPDDVLARISALKLGIIGMWEAPTAAAVKQSADATQALQQAAAEANAALTKAASLSQSLKTYGVVLTVPAAIK